MALCFGAIDRGQGCKFDVRKIAILHHLRSVALADKRCLFPIEQSVWP